MSSPKAMAKGQVDDVSQVRLGGWTVSSTMGEVVSPNGGSFGAMDARDTLAPTEDHACKINGSTAHIFPCHGACVH